ncbi:MAG: hypothetical protein JNM85_07645 [Chthonomonas sp.]|nr:hypothetical protein [Chthonomonas sp.]
MEIIPYGGWSRCARLVSGDVDAVVTLEVGPRVIRFGRVGGPNEFVEYERHRGMTGGDQYRSYGGHRLWVAPERASVTYEPDNEPVEILEEDGWTSFRAPVGPVGIQKTLSIRPIDSLDGFTIRHALLNSTCESVKLAPWGVTVMAPGGECIFPQAPPRPHTEALLPARPLVMWHYTKMQDPRWTWGDRVVRLRHNIEGDNQKVGACVSQGYAAYANNENLFLKRFAYHDDANYPDFGSNFETFTRTDMLEIESLGGLVTLAPGESTVHWESWYLIPDVVPPRDDSECYEWLEELVSSHGLITYE